MLRHVIEPARSFAQIPNAILRHPRLSADAKTLLTWQLSLPADARQSLSETAHKAGIKKVAFQKAKRQLMDEGYAHEWRMRLDSGRCVTVQLVSNVPLSAKEALAVRDGLRPAPAGTRVHGPSGHGQPTATPPAAGQPTGRPACRQPKKDREENTAPPTTPAPPQAEHRDDGERLLHSLAYGDRRLAMSARTARRWAPLAGAWLDSGMPRDRIRRTLTDGLGDARNPLGVLRWRLEHALPGTVEAPAPAPKAPPRLRGMRECRSDHIQPRLFVPRPGHDDELCPACRAGQPADAGPSTPSGSGYAAFLAARRATCTRPPVREVRVTAFPRPALDTQASCEGEAEG
jgi:hypothetical protein